MLNHYRNMIVLKDRDEMKLLDQIKEISFPVEIVAMYGMNGHHFAYLVPDRPVKRVVKKKATKKKTLDEIQTKLNEGV
jgi:hypothetical protein